MYSDNEFQVSTFNLEIFDKDENKLLEVKTLQKFHMQILNSDHGNLVCSDATFNRKLYNILNPTPQEDNTDYLKSLNLSDKKKIIFNFKTNKDLPIKLVAKGWLHKNDGTKYDMILNIPNAMLHNEFDLNADSDGISQTHISISFEPYNEQGDMFELITKNQ